MDATGTNTMMKGFGLRAATSLIIPILLRVVVVAAAADQVRENDNQGHGSSLRARRASAAGQSRRRLTMGKFWTGTEKCTPGEQLAILKDLPPSNCHTRPLEIVDGYDECALTQRTACSEPTKWLETYWKHQVHFAPDSISNSNTEQAQAVPNFVGLTVGCSNGFDLLKVLRMADGYKSQNFNAEAWHDALLQQPGVEPEHIFPVNDQCPSTIFGSNMEEEEKDPFHLAGEQEPNQIPAAEKNRLLEMRCIEPLPKTVAALTGATESLGWSEHIKIDPVAIGRVNGRSEFPLTAEPLAANFGLDSCKHPEVRYMLHCRPVNVYTLDSYAEAYLQDVLGVDQQQHINFLQINSVGFESDVLQGGSRFVLKNTEYLTFAHHPWGSWTLTSLKRILVDYLDKELGFTCYWSGSQSNLWRITGHESCFLDHYDKSHRHHAGQIVCVNRNIAPPSLVHLMEASFKETLERNEAARTIELRNQQDGEEEGPAQPPPEKHNLFSAAVAEISGWMTMSSPLPPSLVGMSVESHSLGYKEVMNANPTCFKTNIDDTTKMAHAATSFVHTYKGYDKPNAPVINVGLPFQNHDLLTRFFQCAGFDSINADGNCPQVLNYELESILDRSCGRCFQQALDRGQSMLESCKANPTNKHHGKATAVWMELADISWSTHQQDFTCVVPQCEYLEQLSQEAPHATFVLPVMEDIHSWLDHLISKYPPTVGGQESTLNYGVLLDTKCPYEGLTGSLAHAVQQSSDNALPLPLVTILGGDLKARLAQFACNHMQRIRQFVKDHPSHTLIEVNVDQHPEDSLKLLNDIFQVDYHRQCITVPLDGEVIRHKIINDE
jgi:hypothetical protein